MKADLYLQRVALERPVLASDQLHLERSRLFLRLKDGAVGFGEVSPQPVTLNGDPSVDDVVDEVADALARVEALAQREGALPAWTRMAGIFADSPPRRFAGALIEMALLDHELRHRVMSIGELWPRRTTPPRQTTVSALDERTWEVSELEARVRVKTAPGVLSERALEQLSQLRVPVLLDYNCSATSDEDVLTQVTAVREVATLDAVEQPYAVGNLVDHARLATRLDVALSLDESVRSLSDLIQINRYQAASMVCVKPARVGGLANARTIIAHAQQLGLRVYLGGFFESPYARRVHWALASGSAVTEPSDLGDVALEDAGGQVTVITSSFGREPSASMLAAAESLSVG
jgi:L-alanine-DL-glutamate epimerase-like enolase superfamily enzyme